MIFLKTDRLILRQTEKADALVMFDYRNQEVCAQYQRGQVKDLAGLKALVEAHKGDDLTGEADSLVVVALRDTGEMVGEIVVMPNDDCFSLGYTISDKHHRKGYAYEALLCLTDFLHEKKPSWEFISFVESENTASRRLLEKLGYTDLGYIEKLASHAYGKWIGENPFSEK